MRALAQYGIGTFRVRRYDAHGPRIRCMLAVIWAA